MPTSETLTLYMGSKYGKAKKKLVDRAAKKLGYKSSAKFVWSGIRSKLPAAELAELDKLEALENR